jgi:hypothetical protein
MLVFLLKMFVAMAKLAKLYAGQPQEAYISDAAYESAE